jgi:hypothetical protein
VPRGQGRGRGRGRAAAWAGEGGATPPREQGRAGAALPRGQRSRRGRARRGRREGTRRGREEEGEREREEKGGELTSGSNSGDHRLQNLGHLGR